LGAPQETAAEQSEQERAAREKGGLSTRELLDVTDDVSERLPLQIAGQSVDLRGGAAEVVLDHRHVGARRQRLARVSQRLGDLSDDLDGALLPPENCRSAVRVALSARSLATCCASDVRVRSSSALFALPPRPGSSRWDPGRDCVDEELADIDS